MQTQTTDDNAPTLYAHSKRPRWGFAILAWEGREQRRYQFQDGQLRTFKRGYYELLEEVEDPVERAVDIVRDLKAMLRIERGPPRAGPDAEGARADGQLRGSAADLRGALSEGLRGFRRGCRRSAAGRRVDG